MNPDYFTTLFNILSKKLKFEKPKIKYVDAKDDFWLSYDIFSYLTYCQDEAIELKEF